MLIKPIETSSRHPTEIDGCRTQPPDRNALSDKPRKNLQRTVGLIQIGIGKTGHQTGAADLCLLTYLYLFIIQRSAISFLSKKELIDKRIIHRAQYHLSILFDADGYATQWKAMCKINGPIYRIDDPFHLRVHNNLPGLFA